MKKVRFDLIINYKDNVFSHKRINFPDCFSVFDVRVFLNNSHRLLDIGDIIHNMDNVEYIRIWESEEVEDE